MYESMGLLSALLSVYSEEKAWLWLASPNPNLDGRRPVDLFAVGEFEAVTREIYRLSDTEEQNR